MFARCAAELQKLRSHHGTGPFGDPKHVALLLGVYTSWGGNCVSLGNLDDAHRVYQEALALVKVATESAPAAHAAECRGQVRILEGMLGQIDALQREATRGTQDAQAHDSRPGTGSEWN